MKLTPLDIRKREFDRSLRGYDPQEVEAFLDMVAEQWQDLEDEHRRLQKKVEELEGQMEHYRKVEEALQTALDQTRENAEQQIENAREKAETIVEKAKADARAMEREAKKTIAEAEAKADDITREARNEREKLRADVQRLRTRRTEVVAQLRAFLHSELEVLEKYDAADAPPPSESGPASEPATNDAPDTASSPPEDNPPSGPGGPSETESTAPDLSEASLDDANTPPSASPTQDASAAADTEAPAAAPSSPDADLKENSVGEGLSDVEEAETTAPDPIGEPLDDASGDEAPLDDDDPSPDVLDPLEEIDVADSEETSDRPPSEVFTNDVATKTEPPARPSSSRPQGDPYAPPSHDPAPEDEADAPSVADGENAPSEDDATASSDSSQDVESDRNAREKTETRKRTRTDDQATSEEIEKIWNILDDMEE